MRELLTAVAILFLSQGASSCPDLAGTWKCQYSNGDVTETQVSQEAIPSGVAYHLHGASGREATYEADGLAHTVTDPAGVGTILTTCTDMGGLSGRKELKGREGEFTAVLDFHYSWLDDGRLQGATHTEVTFAGAKPQVSDQTSICTRL